MTLSIKRKKVCAVCPYLLFIAVLMMYNVEKKTQHPQGLCSLAPGYNMCILRGSSVSDSFVTVIGDEMELRKLSIVTLQAVTVVL